MAEIEDVCMTQRLTSWTAPTWPKHVRAENAVEPQYVTESRTHPFMSLHTEMPGDPGALIHYMPGGKHDFVLLSGSAAMAGLCSLGAFWFAWSALFDASFTDKGLMTRLAVTVVALLCGLLIASITAVTAGMALRTEELWLYELGVANRIGWRFQPMSAIEYWLDWRDVKQFVTVYTSAGEGPPRTLLYRGTEEDTDRWMFHLPLQGDVTWRDWREAAAAANPTIDDAAAHIDSASYMQSKQPSRASYLHHCMFFDEKERVYKEFRPVDSWH